ncbi:hypothetical protein ACVME8_007053 [Bradyrhizobium diazoefficiens]
MNDSGPNPLQPLLDIVVAGSSKLVVTLVLGAMIYAVVALMFNLMLRGRPRGLREFCDVLARGVGGLSTLSLFYLAFVVIEPVRPGVTPVVFGPFMMLALLIGAVLGCAILLLVLLGAGKSAPAVESRPKRRRRTA